MRTCRRIHLLRLLSLQVLLQRLRVDWRTLLTRLVVVAATKYKDDEEEYLERNEYLKPFGVFTAFVITRMIFDGYLANNEVEELSI